jgi:hypothetical protein
VTDANGNVVYTNVVRPVKPQWVYLVDVLSPYRTKNFQVVGDGNYVMMGGNAYYNGFVLDKYRTIDNSIDAEIGYAYYNLTGSYTKLSGLIGFVDNKVHSDGWDVKIYGDDTLLYTQRINPGDLPKAFSIDVTGVEKLEFLVNRGQSGGSACVGILDLKLYK